MTTPPAEELLPPLVSADELISYMSGISLTVPQKAEAESTLRGVQSELEMNLNRPVQPIHIREVVQGDCSGNVYLSVTPVHRVIKVDSYSSAWNTESVTQLATIPMDDIAENRTLDDGIGFGTNYRRIPGGIWGGYANAWVMVEYIGGYIGYWDQALKQAIKRVAAREIEGNHDDSVNLRPEAGGQTAASDPRDRGWTDKELLGLSRLKRRVIA